MVNKVKQLNVILGFLIPGTSHVFPDVFVPHNAVKQCIARVTGNPSSRLVGGVFVGLHEFTHKSGGVGVLADCNFFHVLLIV